MHCTFAALCVIFQYQQQANTPSTQNKAIKEHVSSVGR